jgi:leucyl aminopeptidase
LPLQLREALAPELERRSARQHAAVLRVASTEGTHDLVVIHVPSDGPGLIRNALCQAAADGRLRGSVAVIAQADAAAAAEGLALGAYRFREETAEGDSPQAATIVLPGVDEAGLAEARAQVESALGRAQVTNWARRLVDLPPGQKTPETLARMIVETAEEVGLKARTWTPAELAEHGFGGLIGVGQGSASSPRMVELTLERGSEAPVVLIGKGVTFDAGGLSIKNDRNQAWMKADMGGAAAVAAAMVGAAREQLPLNVTGLLLLVENMPSGTALRPGDVLRHPNGRTTEVTNTDAEGRLILADALAYAAGLEPSALVDVATLTSALLGSDTWMLFSNEDGLAADILVAGQEAGDHGWRLPLLPEMTGPLASTVADFKNYSFDHARVDTLAAAAFLASFAGSTPWAHLDVVGTAFRTSADRWPAGATGSPTRALLQFLTSRSVIGRQQ